MCINLYIYIVLVDFVRTVVPIYNLKFDMNYEVMLFVYCALVVDGNVVKVVFRCSCCFIFIVIEN